MKKEIRTVNQEKGIMQCTLVDERWYIRPSTNKVSGLPEYEYVPSVTWIAEHYPKGIGFYRWLADKGWDESVAIKEAAADKGSTVHLAIADLIAGKEVKLESQYPDKETGDLRELTLEEYDCIMSFVEWYKDAQPTKILRSEYVVWNDEYNYAGTIDLICEIDGGIYLIDFKTSQNIYSSHEIQLSAYAKCLEKEYPNLHLGILQLGYRKNKSKFKYTNIDPQFDLFLAARKIWQKEKEGVYPKQKDYPLSLSLNAK